MSLLVDVGGYRLALDARGAGEPSVIFVSGLGDTGDIWAAAIAAMHERTKVITYERPGLGKSDAYPAIEGRRARSYGEVASELRHLLEASQHRQPAILVGHSIGAHVAIAYASQWPDDTAGLVTVDATDPSLYIDIADSQETILDGEDERSAYFDWVRGMEEFESQQRPNVPAVVVSSSVGRWATASEPDLYRPFTLDQVDARWQAWQRRLASELHAALVVASTGGHYVHTDIPRLVASAVDEVVLAARNRRGVSANSILET